jgi:glycosyltransferase involved in cell wall biosynthesis
MDADRLRYRWDLVRQGPEATLYAYLRRRRRLRNEADDQLELPPGEAAALRSQLDATEAELAANARVLAAYRAAPGPIPAATVEWLVPWVPHALGGGVRTLLRFADHLARRHGVLNAFRVYDRTDAAGVARMAELVHGAFPALAGTDVRPADAVDVDVDVAIATSWESALALVRRERARTKLFFVQDDEPRFYAAGSMSAVLAEVGRIGFPGIVNTPGLAEVYRGYGAPAAAFVPAVDHDIFHPPPVPRADAPVRIAFYGRPATERNAFALGLRALRLVKERHGDAVEIVSAGEDWSPGQYGVADVLRNAGALRGLDAVADLYRSAHVGLVFMLTAHPSYQPLEYMACGVATVTNRNPHNEWLLRHERNALLARPLPSLVADQLSRLVEDRPLRERIAAEGRATVSGTDWDAEFERVWRAVTKAGAGPGLSPAGRC